MASEPCNTRRASETLKFLEGTLVFIVQNYFIKYIITNLLNCQLYYSVLFVCREENQIIN